MTVLRGKTALVTGGASGIGLAMSRAFAARGARVAIADVDLDRASAAAQSIGGASKAIPVQLDVTREAMWTEAKAMVEDRLGPVSLLCNNAGVGGGPGKIDSYPVDLWRWTFEVNVHSMLMGLRHFLPSMKASAERCHIVNTASMVAIVPPPNSIAYLASKYAVVGLTEGLRHELRGTDIGVSLLCPGMAATRIVETSARLRPGASETHDPKMEAMKAVLAGGMNPDAIGEKVARSVEADDFYIFTHPEWAPLHAEHSRAIADSFGESADPEHRDDLSILYSTLTSSTRTNNSEDQER